MKKNLLLTLKIILFIALFLGVGRFCHKKTGGFQLYKIYSLQDADPNDPGPTLSEQEKSELNAILAQPFTFFGKGGQCYAFISEDKQTVLKLFKNHHIRLWKFLSDLSLPSVLDPYRQKILRKIIHQSPAFFESCELSYQEMREHTGLIYLHLNKTGHINKKLTIIDKLGIAHQIDLDSVDFALQKKAELAEPKIALLIKQNDLDGAKQCIDSLLGLILERCQKGIHDRDFNYRTNVGFIGNRAIEIDLGSYSKDESLKNPDNFKRELLANTRTFNEWLLSKSPDLSLFLSERIEDELVDSILAN